MDDETEAACSPGATDQDAGGARGYQCSQTGAQTYACLTRERWAEILRFAAGAGMRVALCINACKGRAGRDSPMDLTNAAALLNFTARELPEEAAAALHAFELGNEVVNCRKGVGPKQWAASAAALRAAVASTWAAYGLPAASAPLVVGPGDSFDPEPFSALVRSLAPSTLAALTYHDYPQCEPAPEGSGVALDPLCVGDVQGMAEQLAAFVGEQRSRPGSGVAPEAETWLGEGADHVAKGGTYGTYLQTFRSSLYYADALAAVPAAGVALHARQCLVGGHYGLLDKDTWEPNPDYWVAWTYRHLFDGLLEGRGVALDVALSAGVGNVSGTADLRVHAFGKANQGGAPKRRAAWSSVALVVAVNFNLESGTQMDVAGHAPEWSSGSDGVRRREWHFEAPGLDSRSMSVNGHTLHVAQGHPLPDLDALAVQGDTRAPVAIAPASITFVALDVA